MKNYKYINQPCYSIFFNKHMCTGELENGKWPGTTDHCLTDGKQKNQLYVEEKPTVFMMEQRFMNALKEICRFFVCLFVF